MIRNLRNACLLVTMCVVLAFPAFLLFMQKGLNVELPAWLNGERAVYLSGGIPSTSWTDVFSWEGFISGRLSDLVGGGIEKYVPCRDSVFLANSALQYQFIHLSNGLFQWSCCPTFYGSRRLYIPKEDVLVGMPQQYDDMMMEGIQSFGSGLSQIARIHSDKEFFVVIPDASENSVCNPAMNLVSSFVDSGMVLNVLEEQLGGIENVNIVCPQYESDVLYHKSYYSTDHHWNGFGAYDAFLLSEHARGHNTASSDEIGRDENLDDMVMNGSYSRDGLMLLNESVCEPNYDTRDIVVKEGETPGLIDVETPLALSVLKANKLRTEFDFYHLWYGPSSSNELWNPNGEGNSLLICDSFGSAFRWPLGMQYENVSVELDLYGNKQGDDTLEQRIEDSSADVVYLNACAQNISRLTTLYPQYFGN